MDSMDVDLIINHPTGYLDHETITRLYHQYLR
jgi:hypothetical protein